MADGNFFSRACGRIKQINALADSEIEHAHVDHATGPIDDTKSQFFTFDEIGVVLVYLVPAAIRPLAQKYKINLASQLAVPVVQLQDFLVSPDRLKVIFDPTRRVRRCN